MKLKPLQSRDLNTRVEILRQVDVDNGKGGDTTTWTVIANPWAEVLGQNGREAVIAMALQGISVFRIRLRWRSDILPSDQIRLGGPGGTDLNITSCVDPLGLREQLMILATTASALSTKGT